MATEKEDRIRKRAYDLWEKAGAQHGSDQDHWHEAARQIEDEDARASQEASAKRKIGRPKKSAAQDAPSAAASAEPKKRGRPRKTDTGAAGTETPAKRKPGRPKKSES